MLVRKRYSLFSLPGVVLGASILFTGALRADEILDPPEIVVPEGDLCEDLPEGATLTERIAAGCASPPPVSTPPVDAPPADNPPPPPRPPSVPTGPPGVGVNTTSDA